MSQKASVEEKVISDEAIVELYWNRNEKAIKETDKKYGGYLLTIAYNIVRNKQDSEECLNDTYLGTWNQIPPTRPQIFRVFLSKIMRNIAVDRFRKTNAAKRVPTELCVSLEELNDSLPASLTLEEELEIKETAKKLSTFIRTLEEREEFAFVCRYYYADRISDIAKMLQVSTATVFRILSEVRTRLKEYLEKEGVKIG